MLIFLGRPKKGVYSGLTNAEKCKLYRKKTACDQKKKDEALRKKAWRANLKKSPHLYEMYKLNERHRKLKRTEPAENSDHSTIENANEEPGPSDQTDSSPTSSFSTKQSLHRSLSRVKGSLPRSPHKQAEVVEKLAERYQVKFNFKKTNRGRPRKDLTQDEQQWMVEFLARSDLTYTNPGRKDNVYIGKENGQRIFKQKMYLLWTMRDILDIANGFGKIGISDTFENKFGKLLKFSQLYDFFKVHKEYAYNKNIPHGSCLCEICENCVLLARGLSKKLDSPLPTNPHDLVEKFACDLNVRECAMDECRSCSSQEYDFGPKNASPGTKCSRVRKQGSTSHWMGETRRHQMEETGRHNHRR